MQKRSHVRGGLCSLALIIMMLVMTFPSFSAYASEKPAGDYKIILNGMMQKDFLLDIEVNLYNENDPSFSYQTMLTQENDFHDEVSLPKGKYSIVCFEKVRETEYQEDIWVVSNYDGVTIDLLNEDVQVNILCGDYEFLMAYDGVIYNPGELGGYVTEESVQEETARLISEQTSEEITEENFYEITGAEKEGEKEDPIEFPTAPEKEKSRMPIYLVIGILAAALVISGIIVLVVRKKAKRAPTEEE